MTGGLSGVLRDLRRAARWHRRLLAAGLAAGAVALTLTALSPAPAKLTAVVVAAHDLPGGTLLSASDVTSEPFLPASVPTSALISGSAAVGRVLASAVRTGEPLTDVRLLGSSLLSTLGPGRVAAPVRVSDAASARLLRAGDTVDVVAAAAGGGTGSSTGGGASAAVVAPAARVLTDVAQVENASASEGALVVLAVDRATALALARAAMYARLSLLLRPP